MSLKENKCQTRNIDPIIYNYYKLVMFLQKFREDVYEKNPLGAFFLIQLMMIG